QLSLSRSRTNHVDIDLVARQLSSKRLGETDDCRFASSVNCLAGRSHPARIRGNGDDLAAAARLHPRRDGFAAIEYAAIVDRDYLFPGFRRTFEKWLHFVPSSVVYQDIDWPKLCFDSSDRRDGTFQLSHIEPDVHRFSSGAADFPGGALRCFIFDVRDRDARSLGGQAQRDRAADAAGRASDDCNLAFKPQVISRHVSYLAQLTVQPPSMTKGAPVAKDPSSLARNSAVLAISSGLPILPSAEMRLTPRWSSPPAPEIRC